MLQDFGALGFRVKVSDFLVAVPILKPSLNLPKL